MFELRLAGGKSQAVLEFETGAGTEVVPVASKTNRRFTAGKPVRGHYSWHKGAEPRPRRAPT